MSLMHTTHFALHKTTLNAPAGNSLQPDYDFSCLPCVPLTFWSDPANADSDYVPFKIFPFSLFFPFSFNPIHPSTNDDDRPPIHNLYFFLFFIAFRFLRSFIYISLCCYVLAVRELLFFSLFFIHKGLGVSETHE